jgi:hypothetical protein
VCVSMCGVVFAMLEMTQGLTHARQALHDCYTHSPPLLSFLLNAKRLPY